MTQEVKIAQVDKNWIYGILSITPERFFITAQDHLPANARAPLQSGPYSSMKPTYTS